MAVAMTSSCTGTNNNAAIDAGPSVNVYVDAGEGGAADVLLPAPDVRPADGPAARELGYLWYAGSAIGAFSKAQTQVSSDHGPGYLVVPGTMEKSFHDLVFDHDGNLWLVPSTADQVVRIPGSQLAKGSAPPFPDLTITSPALKKPQSLVFDSQGNLWVLNFDGSGPSVATIVRFDNPMAMSGTMTLAASVTIDPGSVAANRAQFSQSNSIAFDGSGNLWVAAVSTVARLDHALSLSGNVTAAPSAVIKTGDAFASIAFDSAGSLWITGAATGYFVLRIANPGSLTGMVNPTPAARVHLAAGTSMFAGGMGFDADGALWIAMSSQVVKLMGPSSLAGDVTPTPAVVLGVVADPDLASKIGFWPRTPGLPGY
jgi:sugar lactone lactonase YvrE